MLKTVEDEQKKSLSDQNALNTKIKSLHGLVESRHSVITQLQAKLKHAEAQSRLEQTKANNQISKLKNELEIKAKEHDEDRLNLNARIKRLTVELDAQARNHSLAISRQRFLTGTSCISRFARIGFS